MYKLSQELYNLILFNVSSKKKKTPKGWISFSGPCCLHNGETQDKRGRAGIIMNTDGGLSYSCFNCSFTASFIPGRQLNRKFRNLLSWLGIENNEIKRLIIESLRLKGNEVIQIETKNYDVNYKPVKIPGNVKSLEKKELVEYIKKRGFNIDDGFLETDAVDHRLHRRVIIPFYWKDNIVGYTARLIHDSKFMKYFMEKPAHYVYNIDNQKEERKYVIIVEGPFDAKATDGVALCGNHCDEVQTNIVNSLHKQVVVVPDRNKAGQKLIDIALENHWGVSFPAWEDDIDDASRAMERYGRIYTLQSILTSIETNQLKIKLLRKKIG